MTVRINLCLKSEIVHKKELEDNLPQLINPRHKNFDFFYQTVNIKGKKLVSENMLISNI